MYSIFVFFPGFIYNIRFSAFSCCIFTDIKYAYYLPIMLQVMLYRHVFSSNYSNIILHRSFLYYIFKIWPDASKKCIAIYLYKIFYRFSLQSSVIKTLGMIWCDTWFFFFTAPFRSSFNWFKHFSSFFCKNCSYFLNCLSIVGSSNVPYGFFFFYPNI